MAEQDYTQLDRPYDDTMRREDDLPYVLGDDSSSGGIDMNGAAEGQPVKDGGAMNDIWISNFIRSTNWKPKSLGFYIDGRTGYAEFSNVYIVGNITATGGTVGGWTISESELSSGNVKLQSTAERILMGSATAELTGTGIFIGKNGSNYVFRVGNPASTYIDWTGTALNVVGGIIQTATSGARIELRSDTTRINLINSSGSTVTSLFYGSATTHALLTLTPLNDSRLCISITVTSINTSGAIDIVNSGTGQTMRLFQDGTTNPTSAVGITNKGTGYGMDIDTDYSTSGNHGLYISCRPDTTVTTNAAGIYINISSSTSAGNGIFINDASPSSTTSSLKISRLVSNANNISGVKIIVTNSSGRAVGIDLSETAYAFTLPADTTAAGAYKGRIPIVVDAATRYLHYYNA